MQLRNVKQRSVCEPCVSQRATLTTFTHPQPRAEAKSDFASSKQRTLGCDVRSADVYSVIYVHSSAVLLPGDTHVINLSALSERSTF